MSVTSVTFPRWARRVLEPIARRHGFRWQRDELWLQRDSNHGVLYLPHRAYGREVDFSLRIGVVSTRLWNLERENRVAQGLPDEMSIGSLHLQRDVADLLGKDGPVVWTWHPEMDAAATGDLQREVVAVAEQTAVPALVRYMSDEAIRDVYLQRRPFRILGPEGVRGLLALLEALGPGELVEEVRAELDQPDEELERLRALARSGRLGRAVDVVEHSGE